MQPNKFVKNHYVISLEKKSLMSVENIAWLCILWKSSLAHRTQCWVEQGRRITSVPRPRVCRCTPGGSREVGGLVGWTHQNPRSGAGQFHVESCSQDCLSVASVAETENEQVKFLQMVETSSPISTILIKCQYLRPIPNSWILKLKWKRHFWEHNNTCDQRGGWARLPKYSTRFY